MLKLSSTAFFYWQSPPIDGTMEPRNRGKKRSNDTKVKTVAFSSAVQLPVLLRDAYLGLVKKLAVG